MTPAASLELYRRFLRGFQNWPGRGAARMGRCRLCRSEASFSVWIDFNQWSCSVCGRSGNAHRLVIEVLGEERGEAELRAVAAELERQIDAKGGMHGPIQDLQFWLSDLLDAVHVGLDRIPEDVAHREPNA